MQLLKAAALGMGRMAVLLALGPIILVCCILDMGGMPGPLARLLSLLLWPVFGLTDSGDGLHMVPPADLRQTPTPWEDGEQR